MNTCTGRKKLNNSDLKFEVSDLWKEMMKLEADQNKRPNSQMDVLLGLWEAGLIEITIWNNTPIWIYPANGKVPTRMVEDIQLIFMENLSRSRLI